MLRNYFCFLILLWSATTFAQFSVILDPGHGGSDLGASRDTFIESKIVLQIAEKIKTELEAHQITVYLTRGTDSNLSLQHRVDIANQLQADLFISLHANWSRSTSVNGLEFYFSSQNPASHRGLTHSPEVRSEDVIEKIIADLTLLSRQKLSLEFSQQTQAQNPDKKSVIRRAPFYVIENTEMPAVLVEVGFISNQREARKLVTPEYQDELARALSAAIHDYKTQFSNKTVTN